MRADQQTSTWEKDGHKVFIGPVKTKVVKGKNRHYREISLDGEVIDYSQGKDLAIARYRSAFAVESELRFRLRRKS